MKRLEILARFMLMNTMSVVLLSSCKKKDGYEALPAYTETGANTLGCLINGDDYKPKGWNPNQALYCRYRLENGVRSFRIGASNSNLENGGLNILVDSTKIEEGQSLKFSDRRKGNAYGENGSYTTGSLRSGELKIKHLDTLKFIVSGTFWFDAVDSTTGNKLEVREGRFDLAYHTD